jgi:Protein of unknown function (DUF2975)
MKALGKGSIASWVRLGLQAAWWVMWLAAVCLVAGIIGYVTLLLLVQNGLIDSEILTGGAGEVRLGNGSDFHLSYDEPGGLTWPVAVPAIMVAATGIAGALVIIWRLRKLFESFTSGEPFQRENATHLRVIWITMILVEVSRVVLTASTAALVMAFGQGVRVSDVELTFDLSTWGSILILIVLAEVFREGARLKEEQELTI